MGVSGATQEGTVTLGAAAQARAAALSRTVVPSSCRSPLFQVSIPFEKREVAIGAIEGEAGGKAGERDEDDFGNFLGKGPGRPREGAGDHVENLGFPQPIYSNQPR